MLEWLWPWVFVAAPLPLLIYQLSGGESPQPAALQAPFATRWKSLGTANTHSRTGRAHWWILWLVWMLLITATARPPWLAVQSTRDATRVTDDRCRAGGRWAGVYEKPKGVCYARYCR